MGPGVTPKKSLKPPHTYSLHSWNAYIWALEQEYGKKYFERCDSIDCHICLCSMPLCTGF